MTDSTHSGNLIVADVVFAKNGKAFCDSLGVSAAFGKRPADVLRDIRRLDCSADFRRRNFAFREEIQEHSTGASKRSIFDMTRDGFMFLVMGYHGERAAAVKEAIITEFNRMEEALRSRRASVRDRGKKVRNTYTETLKNHGCDKPSDYARATNSIYRGLYGADAAGLRQQHNLPAKANIRDHMSETGLAATLLSEVLSSERITATKLHGIDQCADASEQCAGFVKGAITAERQSRKLVGTP